MSATALYAVRKGLTDALEALPAFAGVQVKYGYQRSPEKRERAFTHRGRSTLAPSSMRAGVTFRDEVGDFDLVILVKHPKNGPDWCADRAATLGTAAVNFVSTHLNWQNAALGVSLNSLVIEGETSLTEMPDENGSVAELVLPIHYTARLEN